MNINSLKGYLEAKELLVKDTPYEANLNSIRSRIKKLLDEKLETSEILLERYNCNENTLFPKNCQFWNEIELSLKLHVNYYDCVFILSKLKRSASNDINVWSKICEDYRRNNLHFYEAIDILYTLHHSKFILSLKQRISNLSYQLVRLDRNYNHYQQILKEATIKKNNKCKSIFGCTKEMTSFSDVEEKMNKLESKEISMKFYKELCSILQGKNLIANAVIYFHSFIDYLNQSCTSNVHRISVLCKLCSSDAKHLSSEEIYKILISNYSILLHETTILQFFLKQRAADSLISNSEYLVENEKNMLVVPLKCVREMKEFQDSTEILLDFLKASHFTSYVLIQKDSSFKSELSHQLYSIYDRIKNLEMHLKRINQEKEGVTHILDHNKKKLAFCEERIEQIKHDFEIDLTKGLDSKDEMLITY